MILYEKGTTDFTKNGFGFLNNVLNASVTEELNGEYSLTFDYPINETLSNELIEERIIKCQVSDGTQQCFIIKKVTKTYEKMTVICSHLFYLLLTDLAEDIYPQNLSPKPFLDWILARANYQLPFTTTSDVSVQKTGRYVRRNLVDVILGETQNSMVNLFGIEIKRNNWNIGLNARLGADRGEKLIYGKNITGIDLTIDTNELYTRIMPVGFDGLLLPEKYIDADNINSYPYPKIGIFEFSEIRYDPDDPSAYQDIDDAYDALRAAVQELYDNHVNEPKINIKVNWLELSKTEEYKQYSNLERVELGDTIHAEIFGINYTTRVIKTIYNPLTDRIEKFEVGTFEPSYATQMNKYEFDLQRINPASILDEAKTNATSLITQAMGGYVYKTNNELYIMDNADPAQAVHVWRWNINGLGYSSTGINGTYGLAMTMNGAIVADFITTGTLRTSVIEGYDSLTTQVTDNTGAISTLTQSVGELNSKIQDVADITTSAESEYAEVQLLNVNESQPIMIKIHPIGTNISYLYPRSNLYPSDTLYMPDRIIKFTNTSTNEVFTYTLFDDLLYYDSTHYDEFYFDYDNNRVQITKRCEYDANGNPVRAIGSDDRQILNPEAIFQGGFNTRVAWKNLDLQIIGAFKAGGILVSSIHSSNGYLNMLTGRRGQVDVDYWTPENTSARYPNPAGLLSGDNPKYGSTLGYFDASYIKIRTITLGYTMENIKWIKKMGVKGLRVYATVQNPFKALSGYTFETGLDPETNSTGHSNVATGYGGGMGRQAMVGYNTPYTRNFLFGVNITF